ncbi:hypothetical protein PR202_ga16006 [Eleusine coracana subsp. coracana]|uniref:VQ domain-containing protein n=1 Tax=Eleusine coracana subsp. coracana TaxID=191504 RepID=A0AAV5CLQ8_ELECO|nr:hypothetical protein PR202_ga16006 [Eleusine coracana subsp. coracana]
MDSGNSGSLQSSSGGDDEFDSRGGGVDSSPLSALFRPAPSPSAAAFSLYGLQEFAPPQQPKQQAGLWLGSFTGAAGASSSSSPRVAGSSDQGGARQQQQQAETTSAAQQPAPPRGSRKRTRASRRAPTTVLTTDTSNFRAMVQEFTGIPSPPFAAAPAASALRTRFDHIFPPSSSLLRSAAGDASASLPPYLLRPFAQKIPSAFPPFTSSSSSSSPLSSSSIGVANANAAAAASGPSSSNPTADTFQLTSSALLPLQQDPSSYLSFQNLLESQSSSHSIFGAAAGGFAQPRMYDPAPSPSEFLAGIGSGNLGGLMAGSSEGMHLHHSRSDVHQHGGDELSGVVASGGSCKPINYSTHAGGAATSSSAAAPSGDKPPDGGAPRPARPARGEGLDPWICTSE